MSFISFALALALAVPIAASAPAASPAPQGGAAVAASTQAIGPITITASNWAFDPAKVTVHAGELTTFRLTSKEGVHGLGSDALGLPATTIMPGKMAAVTFTPKKAGTYKLPCTIVCGAGHAEMAMTVIVLP